MSTGIFVWSKLDAYYSMFLCFVTNQAEREDCKCCFIGLD